MKYKTRRYLFDCFSPDCGAALITAVAEAMAEGLDADQINVLGNFVSAVGDTLAYISAQMQRNEQGYPKKCPDNAGDGKECTDVVCEDNKGKEKNSTQYSAQKNKTSPYSKDASQD